MYGILFYANEALVINGSANVNISVINPTKATLTAMSGIYSPARNPDVRVEGSASLSVSMSYPDKVGVQGSAGIYTNLITDTTGKVSVDTSSCYEVNEPCEFVENSHCEECCYPCDQCGRCTYNEDDLATCPDGGLCVDC